MNIDGQEFHKCQMNLTDYLSFCNFSAIIQKKSLLLHNTHTNRQCKKTLIDCKLFSLSVSEQTNGWQNQRGKPFQQKGASRAKYGSSLLTKLSQMLRLQVGRGYSRPNLNNMRKFYLMYPFCQTSDKLSWSHICELITADNPLEREFYEKECVACNWDVRSLLRQMESGLFLRLSCTHFC